MEEDPLIALVHVWNNAAFDHASASAWHAHSPARATATPARPAAAAREAPAEVDKENHRPADADPETGADVEAEIGHIEAEILRLSSRLHHLRTSSSAKQHPEPLKRGEAAPAPAVKEAKAAARTRTRTRGLSMGPLDVAAAVNPNALATDNKQQQQPPRAAQGPKPIKPTAARGRGVSLGPLDIVAANPRVPSAAATTANPRAPSAATTAAAAAPQRKIQGEGGAARPILRPIKEPPVQRRRGVSLGPLEIHHGVGGSKPGAAAARVKPFANKLGTVREEGGQRSKQQAVPARPWPSSNARQGTAASRAKARSGSMSPSRSRRQSTSSKAAETTRAGNVKAATEAARGANAAALVVSKVADELKPNTSSNAATAKRPAGSSKVRVVPSRYSITPGSSLAAVTQERRCKQSVPGSASAAGQREEIRAKLTEPSNDQLSPETLGKVAELLPKIRTMPPSDESPRDSGCAKRLADLVGKRSFFTAAADDGNLVTPYQARVVELESPEAAAVEA